MKRSKRYRGIAEKMDPTKVYELSEALDSVKSCSSAKFDETVDVVIKLNVDPKKSDQLIRGAVSLPKGIGKSKRVIVFAEGDAATAAENAGAIEVGSAELAKKIKEGWTDFDVAIATPQMMKVVGQLGKVLGPQGKMPSPKSGTVTKDVETAVKEFAAGKIEFRVDDFGNVHAPVGKCSFETSDLAENIEFLVNIVKSLRPQTIKGTYLQHAGVSSSMGPGFRFSVVDA